MPKTKRRPTIAHQKRHGKHQKPTKHFLNTYWPYLPLALSVFISLVVSNHWQPRFQMQQGVLAYATSTSRNGLLSETNEERTAAGKGSLAINSKLNSAAQAKANDMVVRDYWSHNTPEGNPPWVFIDDAGYDYQKAGENLAYGFLTSATTVAGWMNSPAHKANMLDSSFTEVGFGYANSADYQNTGPQTIVVAMYGQPMVAAAQTPPPPPPPPPPAVAEIKPTPPATKPAPAPAPTPAPTPEPVPTPVETTAEATTEEEIPANVANTGQATIVDAPQTIARVQALTNGRAPWSVAAAGLISVTGIMLLLVKHGMAFRRVVMEGERYVLHHALIDSLVISVGVLAFVLTRTAGTIL